VGDEGWGMRACYARRLRVLDSVMSEMATKPLSGLEQVAASMRDAVQSYAATVQELDPANVRSLTMTGAIVSESFAVERSPGQSVLVLERMDLGLLRRLAERGPSLGKLGLAAPLVMTPRHITSSLDTFPLEFIEIQQLHATVFGDDPFAGLAFVDAHVRLECERELKRFLIGLRQGLLAAAGRAAPMRGIQRDAAQGLLRTLRGMLWLKGSKAYQTDERVIAGTEQLLKAPLRGLRAALSATASTDSGIEALYADVEALNVAVDAW